MITSGDYPKGRRERQEQVVGWGRGEGAVTGWKGAGAMVRMGLVAVGRGAGGYTGALDGMQEQERRSAGAGGQHTVRWPPLGLKGLFMWEVLVNDGSRKELMIEGERLWKDWQQLES